MNETTTIDAGIHLECLYIVLVLVHYADERNKMGREMKGTANRK